MAWVHTAHIETSEQSHVRTYVHMFEVQSCGRSINVMALSLDVRENLGSAVQYSLLQYNTMFLKKISIYAHCQYIAVLTLQKSPLVTWIIHSSSLLFSYMAIYMYIRTRMYSFL